MDKYEKHIPKLSFNTHLILFSVFIADGDGRAARDRRDVEGLLLAPGQTYHYKKGWNYKFKTHHKQHYKTNYKITVHQTGWNTSD